MYVEKQRLPRRPNKHARKRKKMPSSQKKKPAPELLPRTPNKLLKRLEV